MNVKDTILKLQIITCKVLHFLIKLSSNETLFAMFKNKIIKLWS